MFRSHSDRRHMPSLTPNPIHGNYMASCSRDGPVSAPCVPGPIKPSSNWKNRLKNTLVHSHSMASITDFSRTDEISTALGLHTHNLLQYLKPRPMQSTHYEELIDDFRGLTLNDLDGTGGSMNTEASVVFPQSLGGGSGACSQGKNDDMSSVELAGFWQADLPKKADTPGLPNSGTIHSGNPETHVATAPNFLSKLNRKRLLRTPSRNSPIGSSSSNSGSPRELIRALVTSARLVNGLDYDLVNGLGNGLGLAGTFGLNLTPNLRLAILQRPLEMLELQYLVTYNLVNNFYYNLVLWSPLSNAIAIAIDSKAYWWDGSSQVRDMSIQRPGLAPVTCVSCSKGDAIAVSFADGMFSIYQITKKQPPVSRRFTSSVQCVEWFPDWKRLVTGDQNGTICLLSYDETSIQIVCHLPGFTQQICGIALSNDGLQVAVGANENLAIVWDISSETDPLEKCRLHHNSAVKGILFCPWAPSLLATGGGSNDRHLRFWHTGSGTLLREIDTKRQITAVFWSSFYKEILLTFGYLAGDDHVAAAIYQYPESRLIAHAHARDPLRALSATIAPDETKVAIAANDGTVRVFGLWGERPYALTGSPSFMAVGSYGSSVVETAEGVDLRAPTVR